MPEHQFRPGDVVKYKAGRTPYYSNSVAPKLMRTFKIKKLVHVPMGYDDDNCMYDYVPFVHRQTCREMVAASQWAILKMPRHAKQKGLIEGPLTSTDHLELVYRRKRK